jgi:dTDP-4-dehydrorhamnose reductase
MRFLLLGGTGQVGEEFRRLTLPTDIEVVTPDRGDLDLRDTQALTSMIAAMPWNAVINAAAYTDVDRAESEETLAFAVNAEAPSRLADQAARRGVPLIHISTDYVFDGRKGTPYVEGDEVGPLNVYGRSKLAGERAVQAANPRHVILRTSWVYSPFRKNFVKTVLRLASERDRLAIVADQRGCPTAAKDIAQACLAIAMRCSAEPEHAPYGVFHFAGAEDTSWFEFACSIVEMAAGQLGRSPQVVPIRTREYPTPARRASDTRLDCSRIVREYGTAPRPWRDALRETLDRLLTEKIGT